MRLQAFNAQEGFHFQFNYQERVCKSPLGNMKSASGMVDEYVANEELSHLLSPFAQNERKDTNQPIWDYQNKPPTGQMIAHVHKISRSEYTLCQSQKYTVQLLDQVIKQ